VPRNHDQFHGFVGQQCRNITTNVRIYTFIAHEAPLMNVLSGVKIDRVRTMLKELLPTSATPKGSRCVYKLQIRKHPS